MPFYCTICEQESTSICAVCTKDTCSNHLCVKCASCSDCCSCELALEEPELPRRNRYVAAPPQPVPSSDAETHEPEEPAPPA
jgi:hypothetical protein